MLNPPPDRSHILSEQRNPRSEHLHSLPTEDIMACIQQEDHAVLAAVEQARPALVDFCERLETKFRAGGRLIYVGAGTSGRLGVLDASEIPPTFHLPPDRVIGIIAGGDSALRVSSEGKEDNPNGVHQAFTDLNITNEDTVLGIAAGGTTPFPLELCHLPSSTHQNASRGFSAAHR